MYKKFYNLTLFFLLFNLFFISSYAKERTEKGLIEMYAEEDLTKATLFQGGFSNFGYWENISLDHISIEQRIESEKNLYRYVLDHLDLDASDKILEIGCGKGFGAPLIHDEYIGNSYIGIDLSSYQIKEAKKLHQSFLIEEEGYSYMVGQAERMPFDSSSFTKLFSVESAQHFYPFENFIAESDRVLKENGKIVFAASFATNQNSIEPLKENLQTVRDDITPIIPIEEVRALLKSKGFVDIHIEPIGKYVFDGFDAWVSQGEYKNSWRREWKKAYDDRLVDYYVVSAYKRVNVI